MKLFYVLLLAESIMLGCSQTDRSPLTLSEVQTCSDPLDNVSYQEVAQEMGLQGSPIDMEEHTEGGAATIADLDLDGDLDIVLGFLFTDPIFYLREGERFIQQHPIEQGDANSLSLVDADLDGRLDLAFAGQDAAIHLNRVSGWQKQALPQPIEQRFSRGLIPGDLNGDGAPDLYVINSSKTPEGTFSYDYMLMNDGAGQFTLDLQAVPEQYVAQQGFDAHWFDWNQDNQQDIIVVNELNVGGTDDFDLVGSYLLKNVDSSFVSAKEACLCEMQVDAMGVDVADFNRDGLFDIYIGATSHNTLLQQSEDGSFVDVSQSTNADPLQGGYAKMSWGTIFLDFDNDGLLDILGAEGDLYHADSTEVIMQDLPIDFLRQTSSSSGTRFERVNERFGLIQLGSWRTVIAMDHNGDGVLDPLITDVEDRPLLFMSQGCTVNSWVEIIGQVGTRIEIEAGGVTQYAAIQSHSSFGGSHSPMAHIGLGRNKTIDRLILTSPNGEVYEATTPIEARRRISFISN